MDTDRLLLLAQWLSPAYPVGAFAWSHGLEVAVAARQVTDGPGLAAWLSVAVGHGAGRSDAILLAHAHRASQADLPALAELALALAPSRARRAETAQQGAAFAATTRAMMGWDADSLPDMAYPLALGRATGLAGVPLAQTVPMFLAGFVANLVGAAQRLMPLGQTEAQGIVARLAPLCAATAPEAIAASLDDLGGAAFAIDIAAMRHEVLEPRIFRS